MSVRGDLGAVIGVLVLCEDGLHLCTDTPQGLREGDFARVNGDCAVPASDLRDKGRNTHYTTALGLLRAKEDLLCDLIDTWQRQHSDYYQHPQRARRTRTKD